MDPLVHDTVTAVGKRFGTDVEKVRQKGVRCGKYPPGAAYGSELTQALSESGAQRVETIESLKQLKRRRVGKCDVATHLIQIINEPHQVIALKILHTSPIIPSAKHVAKLILKLG